MTTATKRYAAGRDVDDATTAPCAVAVKHRYTRDVICTGDSIRAAVTANLSKLGGAYLEGVDLVGACLRGADLRGSNLRDSNLVGSDLEGADLRYADLRCVKLGGAKLRDAKLRDANLRDADLGGSDLRGADLGGAKLRGAYLGCADLGDADGNRAKLSWKSHDLLAEILRRAAGDDVAKLKIAGLVMLCRDKCWKEFFAMRDPLTGWAAGVLREWVQPGDGSPAELTAELPSPCETA